MHEPNSIEKHMILNKLSALLDRAPNLSSNGHLVMSDIPRQWISEARALLTQYDPLGLGIALTTKIEFLSQYPYHSVNSIIGYVR